MSDPVLNYTHWQYLRWLGKRPHTHAELDGRYMRTLYKHKLAKKTAKAYVILAKGRRWLDSRKHKR